MVYKVFILFSIWLIVAINVSTLSVNIYRKTQTYILHIFVMCKYYSIFVIFYFWNFSHNSILFNAILFFFSFFLVLFYVHKTNPPTNQSNKQSNEFANNRITHKHI